MDALTHNQKKPMNNPIHDRALFVLSIILNGGIWANNFSIGLKAFLAIVAGLTTIMAFFNQYRNFSKNYPSLWVIVRINYFLDSVKPKRPRRSKKK